MKCVTFRLHKTFVVPRCLVWRHRSTYILKNAWAQMHRKSLHAHAHRIGQSVLHRTSYRDACLVSHIIQGIVYCLARHTMQRLLPRSSYGAACLAWPIIYWCVSCLAHHTGQRVMPRTSHRAWYRVSPPTQGRLILKNLFKQLILQLSETHII